MNERIQELLKQAVNAVDNPFPSNPLNDELAKMYIPDCFAEKFAELIVRECVNCIENTDKGYIFTAKDVGIVNAAHTRSMKKVKEHFGICIEGIE